jgi:hypothetical protein
MFQMRIVLCFLAAALCTSTILDAQHAHSVPVVNADGPTVVAFFPNASQIGPEDADGNEALSDFKYSAKHVKEPLVRLGIQFTEEYGRSFRISSEGKSALFTRETGTPGYYFFVHGKRPRSEYGVRSDSDLLAVARQYFGLTDGKK